LHLDARMRPCMRLRRQLRSACMRGLTSSFPSSLLLMSSECTGEDLDGLGADEERLWNRLAWRADAEDRFVLARTDGDDRFLSGADGEDGTEDVLAVDGGGRSCPRWDTGSFFTPESAAASTAVAPRLLIPARQWRFADPSPRQRASASASALTIPAIALPACAPTKLLCVAMWAERTRSDVPFHQAVGCTGKATLPTVHVNAATSSAAAVSAMLFRSRLRDEEWARPPLPLPLPPRPAPSVAAGRRARASLPV